MITNIALYCLGVSLYLAQMIQNFQPYQDQECSAVYYVASKSDIYPSSKYKQEELEKLGIEYPLYMGPICLGADNRVISYRIPPESVLHHNIYKWDMKEILETGNLSPMKAGPGDGLIFNQEMINDCLTQPKHYPKHPRI